jgi:hypothetical protein
VPRLCDAKDAYFLDERFAFMDSQLPKRIARETSRNLAMLVLLASGRSATISLPMLKHLKDHALDDQKNFWPVAHWRPEQHEDITPDLCLKVASVQGVIAFAILAFASLASGRDAFARFGSLFALALMTMFVTFYGLMRLGLAKLWNRRAAELRADTRSPS